MKEAVMIGVAIISAILLILIGIQEPKGEGLGAIGGTASIFHGSSPRQKLLDKLIIVFSVLFAIGVFVAGLM